MDSIYMEKMINSGNSKKSSNFAPKIWICYPQNKDK